MINQGLNRKNNTPRYCAEHKMHYSTVCVYCDKKQTKLEQAVELIEEYIESTKQER